MRDYCGFFHLMQRLVTGLEIGLGIGYLRVLLRRESEVNRHRRTVFRVGVSFDLVERQRRWLGEGEK